MGRNAYRLVTKLRIASPCGAWTALFLQRLLSVSRFHGDARSIVGNMVGTCILDTKTGTRGVAKDKSPEVGYVKVTTCWPYSYSSPE